ncbi:flagellar hook-basal body complex protein FliE [Novosphingobium panipatense]
MSIGALDGVSAYARDASDRASGHSRFASGRRGRVGWHGFRGSGFGTMVENMVSETAGALRSAEAQSIKQISGKGDLIDVVTAIGAAETALDTVVAVRDRVVSAYSEIMRMQI